MTLFSDKSKYSEKVTLVGEKVFTQDDKKQKFRIPFSQTQLKT